MSDFTPATGINWAPGAEHGQVQFGRDDDLVVMFYTKSVLNRVKSIEANVRIHDNQVHVRIHAPGERLNIIDRPVENSDKQRFVKQWSAFLQNKTQVPEGTPIELLFPNNPALGDNLRGQGVHTIQQCAKLSASGMDSIGMGAQEYKTLAETYLENAKSGASFQEMRRQIDERDQQLKLQGRQLAQLKEQVDILIKREKNPGAHVNQPAWQPGYDAAADRINNTHPSTELAAANKKAKKKEAMKVQIAAEDFNVTEN